MTSFKTKLYKCIKVCLCICLTIAQRILWRSGITDLYLRFTRKNGAIILMYHSIVDANNRRFIDPHYALDVNVFEKQMRFLAKHRNVISMEQLVSKLAKGISPERGTVVITFDDGYLDNYEIAAPIMDKYNLPATINLASGYVSRGESQWMDQLYYIIQMRTRHIIQLDKCGVSRAFDLRKNRDYKSVLSLLVIQLIEAEHDERVSILSKVRDELKPGKEMPRITLNWEDVRNMIKKYPSIEIGAHTHEHTSLTTIDKDSIVKDLSTCKKTIEHQVGCSPVHFTYPYGRVDPEVKSIIESLGFKSAARTDPASLVNKNTDCFLLPRLNAPKSMTLFKALTGGATLPAISKRLSCNI